MIRNNKLFILILFFLISSCSSIPKNTADGCSIFSEKYLWYKHAKKVEKKWGEPIYIQLAFIKMESDFEEAGDEDVFRKLKADLSDHNITDEEIRKKMNELNEKAKSDFK